jgi:hypothetical protein
MLPPVSKNIMQPGRAPGLHTGAGDRTRVIDGSNQTYYTSDARRGMLKAKTSTRVILVTAMLAPFVVVGLTNSDVAPWSLIITIGLVGWAAMRDQTRFVLVMSVIVLVFWIGAFTVTAITDGGPTQPYFPSSQPGYGPPDNLDGTGQ